MNRQKGSAGGYQTGQQQQQTASRRPDNYSIKSVDRMSWVKCSACRGQHAYTWKNDKIKVSTRFLGAVCINRRLQRSKESCLKTLAGADGPPAGSIQPESVISLEQARRHATKRWGGGLVVTLQVKLLPLTNSQGRAMVREPFCGIQRTNDRTKCGRDKVWDQLITSSCKRYQKS